MTLRARIREVVLAELAKVPPSEHADICREFVLSGAAGMVALSGGRAATEELYRIGDACAPVTVEGA